MKTTAVLLAALLAVLMMLAGGCGQKKNAADGAITITFWHSCVSSTVPALNELIGQFEKEHPGVIIKAQYVPTGDALIEKLITSVQSHTAPDISWIHANFLQSIIEADAIYKMDDFIHGPDSLPSTDLADIFPPLMQEAKWRGTLYSLPMEATGIALLCNRELFRQAGLDTTRGPKDWDELRAYARKLTIDKDGDGKIDQYGFFVPVFPSSGPLGDWMVWQFYPFLFQAGGNVINLEQTHVTYNSDAGVKALTFWKTLYEDCSIRKFGIDYEPAFASKTLAMALDGPWNIPRWKQIEGLDWMVAPLPAGPDRRATIIGGEYLAIFKQSEHPREAWEFVKWMTRPDVQAMWSMKSGYLPIRRAVRTVPAYAEYLESHPNLRTYVLQMDVAQAANPIDYNPLKISRNLAEAIEQATVGGEDPRTVLDAAAAKSDALLKAAKP
ncbi:MAG TPA: ABC transporter substrate-binding protein [Bacteroidota bacterium]|nr:ABC transporter substrate-binding protein [Bacteroidota bacterium]